MKPDAIILAGGKGTRLKPLKMPKALVYVDDETLIVRKINRLKKFADKIIIACGYGSQEIKSHIFDFYGTKTVKKNIIFSEEPEELGTAGALKKALEFARTNNVLVCNADTLDDIDLKKLINFGPNTVCVANPKLSFGLAEIIGNKVIFSEKPIVKSMWVNCGTYYLDKNIINLLPYKGSLEKDIFPNMFLKALKHHGKWHTFDTIKDIEEFENDKK